MGDVLNNVCKLVLDEVSASSAPEEGKEQLLHVDKPVVLDQPLLIPVGKAIVSVRQFKVRGTGVTKHHAMPNEFKALVRDADNQLFAGCMLTQMPDGSLFILMTSCTERGLYLKPISVIHRGKKKVYRLKMDTIPPD